MLYVDVLSVLVFDAEEDAEETVDDAQPRTNRDAYVDPSAQL